MTTRQVAIRLQTDGKTEVKRDFQEIGQAGAGAQHQIVAATDQANVAADRQMAKWKQMAAAAREQQAIEQRQAAFNSVLGVGGGGKSAAESAAAFMAPANGNDAKGMNRVQSMMLQSAGFRTFESLASGMPLSRIVLQQGGEVAAAFGMGEHGLGGVVSGLTKLFTPLNVVLGVTGGAMVAGAAAAMSYEGAIHKLDAVAIGLGATAGMTGDQIERLAESSAKLGGVSISSARDMAAGYLSTGRIGGEVTSKLIGLTKNYAAVTGQDAKKATAELAKAFADPAKGADELNGKLNFLDGATHSYIETLISQNRTTEAQTVLADALGQRLLHAADNVTILGGAFDGLKRAAADAFTTVGKTVDRALGGGSILQQIASLQDRKNTMSGLLFGGRIDKDMAGLAAKWDAEMRTEASAAANQETADARGIMDKVDPHPAKLRELQHQRAVLQGAIGNNTAEDPLGAAKALGKLDADIRAVAAGYDSAADMAAKLKRNASEAAAEARKAAAEAKKQAEESRHLDELAIKNKLEVAKLSGNKVVQDALEHELKLRQLTSEYLQNGISQAKARAMAEHQVGLEIQAQQQGLIRKIELEAKDIVTTEAMQQRWAALPFVIDENATAVSKMTTASQSAFDAMGNQLTSGKQDWASWKSAGLNAIMSIIGEFEKLAILNPLKNLLFGGVAGYQAGPTLGAGFWSSLIKGFTGHNAQGTDNWRGGWSEVGEQGPEKVWMPPGSKVFSNAKSSQMGGQTVINVQVHAQDSVLVETVQGWVAAGVDQAIRQSGSNVTGQVADALSRGRIR
ncbi:MAG: hypothetical protein JWO72_3123 [Caulobacteraceae bacterium]|nr:hypothetical protein [Caulobacteraceae bacterium]